MLAFLGKAGGTEPPGSAAAGLVLCSPAPVTGVWAEGGGQGLAGASHTNGWSGPHPAPPSRASPSQSWPPASKDFTQQLGHPSLGRPLAPLLARWTCAAVTRGHQGALVGSFPLRLLYAAPVKPNHFNEWLLTVPRPPKGSFGVF